jgi:hypothetical protein
MGAARTTASTASFLYRELAAEMRAMTALFVRRMKGDITDVDFAEQAAKVSANLHDIPRELFSLSPGVTLVLIDPEPDSANNMSRLQITVKERNDLIDRLDKAFGKRVTQQTKGNQRALEAIIAMLRQWLATRGHTPLP